MKNEPIYWTCNFTTEALTRFEGKDLEPLVALGEHPVTVLATSEQSAAAEFINALQPGRTRPMVVFSKSDPESMSPYILCEPKDR